jgi:hypothetical protein
MRFVTELRIGVKWHRRWGYAVYWVEVGLRVDVHVHVHVEMCIYMLAPFLDRVHVYKM